MEFNNKEHDVSQVLVAEGEPAVVALATDVETEPSNDVAATVDAALKERMEFNNKEYDVSPSPVAKGEPVVTAHATDVVGEPMEVATEVEVIADSSKSELVADGIPPVDVDDAQSPKMIAELLSSALAASSPTAPASPAVSPNCESATAPLTLPAGQAQLPVTPAVSPVKSLEKKPVVSPSPGKCETAPAPLMIPVAYAPVAAPSPSPAKASGKQPLRLRTSVTTGSQGAGLFRLATGLQAMYATREFCDLKVSCGSAVFPVHRVALAGQSRVLRERLADTETLCLDHVRQPKAVELLLHFFYELYDVDSYDPGCLEVNTDVLRLAHELELPVLKQWAAVFMGRQATTQNAVQCLLYCEAFNLPDVREKLLAKIAASSRAVSEFTADPNVAAQPHLLQEVLKRVATAGEVEQNPSKRARC
mmetsp:Transcript_107177/g.212754  ORF Transcript_107177/g.212754 Transcript_107177/m.212754 type:complete len:420 (-) Transcript_107177:214-1473(-)